MVHGIIPRQSPLSHHEQVRERIDPPARWSWTDRRPSLAALRTLGQASEWRSNLQVWTATRLVWSSPWWCGCPWVKHNKEEDYTGLQTYRRYYVVDQAWWKWKTRFSFWVHSFLVNLHITTAIIHPNYKPCLTKILTMNKVLLVIK